MDSNDSDVFVNLCRFVDPPKLLVFFVREKWGNEAFKVEKYIAANGAKGIQSFSALYSVQQFEWQHAQNSEQTKSI